jgi:hypothetical protein
LCIFKSASFEKPRKFQFVKRASLPDGAKYNPTPEKPTGTNSTRIKVEKL